MCETLVRTVLSLNNILNILPTLNLCLYSLYDDSSFRTYSVRRKVFLQRWFRVESFITAAAVERFTFVHGLKVRTQAAMTTEVIVTERTHQGLLSYVK